MIRLDDPWEHMLYRHYCECALAGDVVEKYDDLCDRLGCNETGSSIVNADQRMVRAGHIIPLTFNRSRMIYVVELGLWTGAPVGSKALHWRDRPKHAGRTRQRGQGGAGWALSPRNTVERDAVRKLRRLLPAHIVNGWRGEQAIQTAMAEA